MNDDPADERADARRRVGLTRELEQTRQTLPRPSVGGTRGYPVWHRIADLGRTAQGLPTDASRVSHFRWRTRLLPFRMTGNQERKENIVGIDQFLMAI